MNASLICFDELKSVETQVAAAMIEISYLFNFEI